MSYRRIRSYRSRDARRYRNLPHQPWLDRLPIAALLAVALAVGIATLSVPPIKAMLGALAAAPGPRPATMAEGFQAADGLAGARTAGNAGCAASAGARLVSTTPCPAPAPATPQLAANADCVIIVPAHPLSAAGLATPYQLTGPDGATPAASGCTMANAANLGAFVQATILDPATGRLSVYEPLVITQGTRPAAAPVLPRLPKHAVVTIDFGFNGTDLTQAGATPRALLQGHCVKGARGSAFGQVSFCHGTRFFRAARRAERQGRLAVPRAGISPKTGQPCPTTRSFTLVDQDPSDNVTTRYLLTATGQTAQFSKANTTAMPHASVITNGSDNALLDRFVDPVLGCRPFTAPDLSRGGAPGTSQALDELSAARSQEAPVALVPENDPMVLINNARSARKTDEYRSMIGQEAVSPGNDAADSPANFCQNMLRIQTRFLSSHEALLASGPSPVPAAGTNLLTFMANRLAMSYANLNCRRFGLADPVKVTLNGSGVATSATFGTEAHGSR
jgi:hypothetical protein